MNVEDKLYSGWWTESIILAVTGSCDLSAVLILKTEDAAIPDLNGGWMWMKMSQSSFLLWFVRSVISFSVIIV